MSLNTLNGNGDNGNGKTNGKPAHAKTHRHVWGARWLLIPKESAVHLAHVSANRVGRGWMGFRANLATRIKNYRDNLKQDIALIKDKEISQMKAVKTYIAEARAAEREALKKESEAIVKNRSKKNSK
jgi:hypothetical protein